MLPSHETAKQTLIRLNRIEKYWLGAHRDFFSHSLFVEQAVQFLLFARTVTFVFQKGRSSIPDYEAWYAQQKLGWKDIPSMKWAIDERNRAEKEGDPKVTGEIRASLIASHISGVKSEWQEADPKLTNASFIMSLPKNVLFDPFVRQQGSILIERRWSFEHLPDQDALKAMSIVYRELGSFCVALFEHLGLKPQPLNKYIIDYSNRLRDLSHSNYISIKDASSLHVTRVANSLNSKDAPKVMKRYKSEAMWKRVFSAEDMETRCNALLGIAKKALKIDGYHIPITLYFKKGSLISVAGAEIPFRGAKYILGREIADVAKDLDADEVIHINEAWTSRIEDMTSQFAEDSPVRGEKIAVHGANSGGLIVMAASDFTRRKISKKVKAFTTLENDTSNYAPFFHSLLEEWDALPADYEDQVNDFHDQLEEHISNNTT